MLRGPDCTPHVRVRGPAAHRIALRRLRPTKWYGLSVKSVENDHSDRTRRSTRQERALHGQFRDSADAATSWHTTTTQPNKSFNVSRRAPCTTRTCDLLVSSQVKRDNWGQPRFVCRFVSRAQAFRAPPPVHARCASGSTVSAVESVEGAEPAALATVILRTVEIDVVEYRDGTDRTSQLRHVVGLTKYTRGIDSISGVEGEQTAFRSVNGRIKSEHALERRAMALDWIPLSLLCVVQRGFRVFIDSTSSVVIRGRCRMNVTSCHASLSPAGSSLPVPKAGMPVKRTPFSIM